MPPSGLIVNDRDCGDFGWITETVSGLTGVLAMRTPMQSLAGALGAVVTTTDPDAGVRPLVFTGRVRGSSNADLKAKLEQLLDYVSQGALEVRTPHNDNRFYVCRFAGATLPISEPTFASGTTEARGSLMFDVTTPFALERLPRTYALTTTGTNGRIYIPLGTGPSRPIIQIRGSATNPVLTLYDAFGVQVGQMGFTVSLSGNDFLGIDCLTRRVSKSINSVVSAADDTRTLGNDFFNFLPRYGSQDAQRFVMLQLSSGRARVTVRRSWKV